MTTKTYNFTSYKVKIILLELAPSLLSALAAPSTDKTQCFVQLSFNLTLQLINGTSSDLQKLLKYFTGRTIVAFSIIPLA